MESHETAAIQADYPRTTAHLRSQYRSAVRTSAFWPVMAPHAQRRLETPGDCVLEPFEMALKQLQLVVRGRVQAVYFRASTQREARRLGLSGWVSNRADGGLEIVAEGEEASIRELYSWTQKGPSAARVDRVETRWRSFTGEYPDFRIVD